MSDCEFSLSDWPHSADEVREAVREALPEVTVRDASGVEEGRNTVYLLTTDDSTGVDAADRPDLVADSPDHPDLVLKVGTTTSRQGAGPNPTFSTQWPTEPKSRSPKSTGPATSGVTLTSSPSTWPA